MAIHPILRVGDPRLLRIAEPVRVFDTPELNALIADLKETMESADGVGIAAPQIGVNLQLVVFGFEHSERYPEAPEVPWTVLINPVITPQGEEEEADWEGCLSVPGMQGLVPRWKRIRYQGFDARGQAVDRQVEGFHARVVQHECDHLIGRLYPTRIRDLTQFGFTQDVFPQHGPLD